MRIVLDTNTIVSGLLWPGPPRRLSHRARAPTRTLCTSVLLLAELSEVIGRKKFAQRLQAAGLSPVALVQDVSRLCVIVGPASLLQPVCRDPDDDVVLATAIS